MNLSKRLFTFRTSTGFANLRVGEFNGPFVRSSSSAKYKLVIENIKVDPYKILDVNPVTGTTKKICRVFELWNIVLMVKLRVLCIVYGPS